jgi:hypothetical protein
MAKNDGSPRSAPSVRRQNIWDDFRRDRKEYLAHLLRMLSGLAAMVKTSILNGLWFDPFSIKQDGLASSEVDIGRSEIGDALVVSQMIIVSDEVADLGFEIARKIVVLKQNAVLQRLVPSFDLALGLRMWAARGPLRFQCLSAPVASKSGALWNTIHMRLELIHHLLTDFASSDLIIIGARSD